MFKAQFISLDVVQREGGLVWRGDLIVIMLSNNELLSGKPGQSWH